jgi:hypothetical protein
MKGTGFSPVKGTGFSPVKGMGFSPYVDRTELLGL